MNDFSTEIVIRLRVPPHSQEWLQFGVDLAYAANCKLYEAFPELECPSPETVEFSPIINVGSTDCVTTLFINGIGECKDLGAAIAAYWTVRLGRKCRAIVIPVLNDEGIQENPGAWHCIIKVEATGQEIDINFAHGMREV